MIATAPQEFDGKFIDDVAVKARDRFLRYLEKSTQATGSRKTEADPMMAVITEFYLPVRKSNILDRMFKSMIVIFAEQAETMERTQIYDLEIAMMSQGDKQRRLLYAIVEQVMETAKAEDGTLRISRELAFGFFGKMIHAGLEEFVPAAKALNPKISEAGFHQHFRVDSSWMIDDIQARQDYRARVKAVRAAEKAAREGERS